MLTRAVGPGIAAASAIFAASRFLPLSRTSASYSTSMTDASWTVRSRKNGFASQWPYSKKDFQRMDEESDDAFYSMPRFVTHIDDRCIDALSKYYGHVLPAPLSEEGSPSQKPRILDLASSWISHLPENWTPSNTAVVGIGMSQAELSKNRALAKHLVMDLNEDPRGLSAALAKDIQTEAEKYDAAICSVSIDYLVKPREMLEDLAGILKKDASVHFAFSNRCFPSKVVGRWLRIDEEERCDMVADYLHFAGTADVGGSNAPGQIYKDIEIVTVLKPSWSGDPLYVVRARRQ